MKQMRKILSLILLTAMLLSLGTTAFAAEPVTAEAEEEEVYGSSWGDWDDWEDTDPEVAVVPEEPAVEEPVVEPVDAEELPAEEPVAEEEPVDLARPANTFFYVGGSGLRVTVEAPEGAFPIDAEMTVTEVRELKDVQEKIDSSEFVGQTAVVAADISFTDGEGVEIQPDVPVQVTLKDSTLADLSDPVVLHIADDGELSEVPQYVDGVLQPLTSVSNSASFYVVNDVAATQMLSFEAESFSTYVIAGQVSLSDSFLTDDGLTCTVTVTYDESAGIPEGASLQVTEVAPGSEEEQQRRDRMGDALIQQYGSVAIADVRFLNISILVDGQPFEALAAPVDVKIVYSDPMQTEPEDTGYENEVVVIHYKDDQTREFLNTQTSGNGEEYRESSFRTGSFSDYDIVSIRPYDTLEAAPIMLGAASGNDLNPLTTGKTLTYNNDGTYTLSLSVKGDSQSSSETTTQSANVLIIYDVSNSMTANRAQSDTGSMGAYGSGGQGGAEASYYQLYKSQNTNNPLAEGEEYDGTLYMRRNNSWSTYTGQRYSNAYRSDAAEKALYDMVTDIADGDIEFSLVTFSSSASVSVDWTKDASQITGKLSSTGTSGSAKLGYSQGTGWTNALNKGLDQLAKADAEPTYVIFITDGRPSDGYSNSYTPARRINTYNTADHSYNSSTPNTTLFGIYAYGLQEDYLDDVVYYALNGSARSNVSDETDTAGITNNYFRAGSTQALQDAIATIKQNIKNSLDYGGVSYEDGIATDTTNTTLSTAVSGDLSGLTYTVSAGDSTVYTVTTSDGVKFNIGGTVYNSAKGTTTIDDTPYEYYYAVDASGDPLTFTVGEGDTARTYRYMMGLATMTNGNLDWDLTGIGGLVGGYTYTLSFTVWPVQGAYDMAADLNNGLATWDTSLDTYEDLTSTKGYEKGGAAGYPNIVKYPNGTYAVLTNTSQEVTYYVVETETIDGVETTTYDGPYTTTPTAPSPMSLAGSTIDMVKEWQVSLSPKELQDWVDAGNTLTLRVTADNNKYVDYIFPKDGMITDTDEAGNVTWTQSAHIAPGMMVSKDKAEAAGIDVSKYDKVTMDGVEYYILGAGHDYTVEEIGGSDLHFEFSTETYHPMLVDGVLKNILFSDDGAEVVDANLTELKATNKLKGGISIYKEVYKENMTTRIEDNTDVFAFKVTLWAEGENGTKTPVYTTDDQFENGKPISGSFGYRVYEPGEGDAVTTVQRDAIYAGTSPAQVTVGTEVTEMIFTMQANQYCYIVNVPAGTKYTVEELQSDGGAYQHFYSSVSVLEGDDTTGIYEVVTEKKVEGDATALTDHAVGGYVSANSSSKAIFKNWASYFYVYHSATNKVEKISFADERVKSVYDSEKGLSYEFDITKETLNDGDVLYGGYYKDYAGKSSTFDGGAKVAADDWDENNIYTDEGGTVYDGSVVAWSAGNVYYEIPGTKMQPVGGTTYYLKEVPASKYLQAYTHYTYYLENNKITKLWEISDIDDVNYRETGFQIVDKDGDKIAKVCASLKVTAEKTGESVTLKPENVFRSKGCNGTDYLTYYAFDMGVLSDLEDADVLQYWVTPDNVEVTSTAQRHLTNVTQADKITVDDSTTVPSTIEAR